MKNIRVFYLNIFNFLAVKFSIYLNWRVFVILYGLCTGFHGLSLSLGVICRLYSVSVCLHIILLNQEKEVRQ